MSKIYLRAQQQSNFENTSIPRISLVFESDRSCPLLTTTNWTFENSQQRLLFKLRIEAFYRLVCLTMISVSTATSMASLPSVIPRNLSQRSKPLTSFFLTSQSNSYSIIAVTGLAAHAFGSWAHSAQNMWLRDYLPRDVSNARILLYGYPSQLQGNISRSILSDHSTNLIQRLLTMRESAKVCFFVPCVSGSR